MSWAEVKKINDNMDLTLDQLFVKLIGGFHREYIYSSKTYEIPWDGVFTIRAYHGTYGGYGKVVKKFSKGELLSINMTNEAITINSNQQNNATFHVNIHGYGKYVNVNSNSPDSVRALGIGGSANYSTGGAVYVRSNNGIAVGGGGSGGGSNSTGYSGGAAYAYGNNCYAFGGGGGGGGAGTTSTVLTGGTGGAAYINGTSIDGYCNINSFTSGKGYDGGNSYYSSSYRAGGAGGNGGCGGGAGISRLLVNTSSTSWQIGGYGVFSDGGYIEGGSGRGGSMDGVLTSAHNYNAASKANITGGKGYFAGANGANAATSSSHSGAGGIGGFIGGRGGSGNSTNSAGGTGGFSYYGIGGTGGASRGNNANYNPGTGGDGKLFGGNGGYANGSLQGGKGGNGYYPGKGGKSAYGSDGDDGIAIMNNVITSTFPIRNMDTSTSVVIIEAGDSIEDF